jgi:hypothetical protein
VRGIAITRRLSRCAACCSTPQGIVGSGSHAGWSGRRCVPSHKGLLLDRPQPHSITRLRVSSGSPSDRSIGIPPVTQRGPAIGPLEVISVTTATCSGKSGSLSGCPSSRA